MTNTFMSTVTCCEGSSLEFDINEWRRLTFRIIWHRICGPPQIEYDTTHGEKEIEVLIDVLRKYGIKVTNHETEIEEFPDDEIKAFPSHKVTKDTLELDVLHASKLDVYEIWKRFLEELKERKLAEQTESEYISNELVAHLKETQARANTSGDSS